MGIVIDTNVFIDAENGRADLSQIASLKHYKYAYIAAVTVSELLAGVHLAEDPGVKIVRSAFVEGILAKIPVLQFDEEVARIYAGIYSYFIKAKGRKEVNVHDLQIAATAIAHGYPVLTSNISDFKKIPGLRVEIP